MTRPLGRRLRAAVQAVSVLLTAALIGGCAMVQDPHPSDAQIAEELRNRRQLYEQLLEMVREEKRVTRIGYDFIALRGRATLPTEEMPLHLPPARHAEYRRLFDALELDSGVDRSEDGSSVGFLRSSAGLMVSGSLKSLVWEPEFEGPSLAADDRRTLRETCPGHGFCEVARRIDADWYILYSGG